MANIGEGYNGELEEVWGVLGGEDSAAEDSGFEDGDEDSDDDDAVEQMYEELCAASESLKNNEPGN